jgi:glutamine synthetase
MLASAARRPGWRRRPNSSDFALGGSSVSFVERHGLWTPEQKKAAEAVEREVAGRGLGVVRFSFADQHGILRGKTVVAEELPGAMRAGVGFTTTLLAKDTAHRTVFPVFTQGGGFGLPEMQGAADILMVPDPTTFKILPWAPHSGWLLCDLYFADGRPVPFSTRRIFRDTLNRLNDQGYDYVSGLEVEFHVFRLEDPKLKPEDAGQPGNPPEVSLLTQGYQYLTEQRYDQYDGIYEILRKDIQALGLPLRSLEVEFGPSQAEFTFRPGANLESADTMVLFRSAAKQIARRHGYHVTFMCRPKLPNVFSSGWHLHQSLVDRKTGANAFIPEEDGQPLSKLGRHFLAGLLEHAPASAAFAAPTINAYRRYRPYSLAPDRAIWGRDNRGVMCRVLGAKGDPASRIENRLGEPAANPYLYMASQLIAGMDGMAKQAEPPPSADVPYETPAPMLPRSLEAALAALRASDCYRAGLGDRFVDYFLHIKEAEIARYQLEVSEWEHREYFEMF